jgi:two-component system alkaline phosphatase synthesis response regulator PhoP
MSQTSRRKRKILVVDDVPFVRVLVKRFLGKDYKVIEAGDGVEAVDIAQDQKPDLILMDIMMPRMDGYTSCYKIKSDPSTRGIPVVMLTAVGYELNVKLSKDMGADGYITKPFTSEDLHSTIDKLLASPSISNGIQSSES